MVAVLEEGRWEGRQEQVLELELGRLVLVWELELGLGRLVLVPVRKLRRVLVRELGLELGWVVLVLVPELEGELRE